MARNSSWLQCANYFIIFSTCIDLGDGRWKERDKENLQHDLMAYRRIEEKLEHEIEAFYEEYPEWRNSETDGIHYKYLTNLFNRYTETTKGKNKEKEKHNFPFVKASVYNGESNKLDVPSQRFTLNDTDMAHQSDWPKFDDLLLAMGRKYDWKNDRWIKVRMKIDENEVSSDKSFHEKHKFSYRLVKLNRKAKRNIVVAVSAVR